MNSIKLRARNALKKYRTIVAINYYVRHFIRYYITNNHGRLSDGEVAVFKAISDDIKNLFDVGARFDTDYLSIGDGKDIEFFLFEPNPKFYRMLVKKIEKYNSRNSIKAFNIGLADEEGLLTYYEDTQSFARNHHLMESKIPGKSLRVSTLEKFCEPHGVRQIDFLKIDVEGLDYQVLRGGRNIVLNSCKYCQFELVTGQEFRSKETTPEDFYKYFSGKFTLYVIRDDEHPMFVDYPELPTLSVTTPDLLDNLYRYFCKGYGVNMLAIRNGIAVPAALSDLMNMPNT